jgi:hypothetical protein
MTDLLILSLRRKNAKKAMYWLACWLATLIATSSAWYYPYPFQYGMNMHDVAFSHGVMYWNNDTIAGDVVQVLNDSTGKIIGLRFSNDTYPTMFMGNTSLEFCNSSCGSCRNETFDHWQGQLSRGHYQLALSIVWSVNNAVGNQEICRITSTSPFETIMASTANLKYYDLINRAFAMYEPIYPAYVKQNGNVWSVLHKERYCY